MLTFFDNKIEISVMMILDKNQNIRPSQYQNRH